MEIYSDSPDHQIMHTKPSRLQPPSGYDTFPSGTENVDFTPIHSLKFCQVFMKKLGGNASLSILTMQPFLLLRRNRFPLYFFQYIHIRYNHTSTVSILEVYSNVFDLNYVSFL